MNYCTKHICDDDCRSYGCKDKTLDKWVNQSMDKQEKRIRTCTLINRAAVKRAALDIAERTRAHTFNRVSGEFLDRIEAKVRGLIHSEIKQLPSKGRTIK